ncbi:aminotransferase class V-fold PLP-dependent enzyme [Rubrivirga sp. IMCC43871]|uniref:aminotransferase class V-fold PLP-dependent enzyme n=1 Tax=Rubrivirga sp. IMCC43871 TaxID=3391575 RepID=UPI00398FD8A1
MTHRRDFLRRAGLASAAALTVSPTTALGQTADRLASPPTPPTGPPREAASDEDYWRQIAEKYRVTDRTTNLEAGYFGMMAAPVLAAYHRHTDRVNRESSLFARRDYPELERASRDRVAAALGVAPGEIAFSRNATESLQALIGQYNRLVAGETVMYADLDYPAMQRAMDGLAARRGAHVATLTIPEPASHSAILAAYEQALDANPGTRLLLLTHCNNKTGLIHPVRAIAALARARGVDVVVDAAHSFGQVPLALGDLGADYVGLNLHKWVGAPVGVGAMYIRAPGLDGIDRAHGDRGSLETIDSRLHTGTTNFAAVLTVPDALDFQDAIGVERKAARLRFLRDSWVAPAREIPGVDILTPDDADLVGAITSFRLHGRGSREANLAISDTLQDEFGLFTVQRGGIANGDCVRVTPALYNSPADVDRLVAALAVMAAR